EAGITIQSPSNKKYTNAQDKMVDDYLWSVYQRDPIKSDNSGNFTWKDPSAAQRLNLTLRDYVIGGMSPAFKQAFFLAGKAMDAKGVDWGMLAAFRDDYR